MPRGSRWPQGQRRASSDSSIRVGDRRGGEGRDGREGSGRQSRARKKDEKETEQRGREGKGETGRRERRAAEQIGLFLTDRSPGRIHDCYSGPVLVEGIRVPILSCWSRDYLIVFWWSASTCCETGSNAEERTSLGRSDEMGGETLQSAPVTTSAVLMSTSKHITSRCGEENRAFLNCKRDDPNPEKCLAQGQKVTKCVVSL